MSSTSPEHVAVEAQGGADIVDRGESPVPQAQLTRATAEPAEEISGDTKTRNQTTASPASQLQPIRTDEQTETSNKDASTGTHVDTKVGDAVESTAMDDLIGVDHHQSQRRTSRQILRESVRKIRAMSMLSKGLSSLKNERKDKDKYRQSMLGATSGGKLHGLLQKHMKKKTFREISMRARSAGGNTTSVSDHPNNSVNHGPAPNSHGDEHRSHKGYIDGVITDLLHDEHRGAKSLLQDILHDIETNIHPRRYSLCRAPAPEPRDDGGDGPWDLESIKKAHPHATRRVALSIIKTGVSGVTFDKFRFDSRAISNTNLVTSHRYRVVMVTVAIAHCALGLLEQSYYFDPWAQRFYQPPSVTLPIEFFIIILYACDVALRFVAARNPLRHSWLMLKATLCILFIVDMIFAFSYRRYCNIDYFAGRDIISATVPAELPTAAWFRLFRLLRPLMVLEAVPSLRKEVLSIVHCFIALLPVLFLLIIFVMVFAVVGMYAFPRKVTAALGKSNPTEGDIYFSDIYVSIMTFTQILFGSVIWPDVTMPAMIETSAALYTIFFVFAITSTVVVTNLLTAVVFQAYNERAEREALDKYMQAHVAFAVGFHLISDKTENGSVMTLRHFIALMRELKPQWHPIKFVMRSGQLVSVSALNSTDKKKDKKKRKKKKKKGEVVANRRSSNIDAASRIFDEIDAEIQMEIDNLNDKPERRSSNIDAASCVFDDVDAEFEMAKTKGGKSQSQLQLSSSSSGDKNKEQFNASTESWSKDQVFLVIWRELKKIASDVSEVTSDNSDNTDANSGKTAGIDGDEAVQSQTQSVLPKSSDSRSPESFEESVREASPSMSSFDADFQKYQGKTLGPEEISCQQFMHLPEWLDIEIQREQKLQVNEDASFCMQCRYGGHARMRWLRDVISTPLYWSFFSVVICVVVLTIVLDQVAATRTLGSSSRTSFDGVLLSLMLIDSILKILSVGVVPFLRNLWFLFEGTISLASFLVFFAILIKENGSLDGTDLSGVQNANMTALIQDAPTATFDALYNTGRILNLARILPLFRVLNQNPSMRIILKSVYQSLKYIMNLLFIVVCIWYVWGSLGVEMFGGILRQSEVMDDPQSSYGTAGYMRSPTREASYAPFDSQNNVIFGSSGSRNDVDYLRVNDVTNIVVTMGGISTEDPYYSEYKSMNLTMNNVTEDMLQIVKVSTYERQINFDSLFSTMSMTMVHLTLLNNWHVTFDAVVVAFEAAHKKQFGTHSRNVARFLAFFYFVSFIVVQVVIVLNILISWFFEVYSSYFQQEHELIRHRKQVMEEHKNQMHKETHTHHHHDVEKSLARLFQSFKRPTRAAVCHVSGTPFSNRCLSTRGSCSLTTCDVCLQPTRIALSCSFKILSKSSKDWATPRIQWIMAPKFVHVVLQVSM